MENDLDELWSLFNFVNPGLLGSREGFQKRFAIPIERDRNAHARQALRSLIRPFLLRRTKAAVLSELPPRTEQTMQVEMSEAERAFYEAMRQRALETIAALDAPQGKRKIHILAEITRLRRACCNPALIDPAAGVPSGKLDAFLDLVDDLVRNRHRALVFSQFVGHLALVRAALDARGIRYEYLDGSTPSVRARAPCRGVPGRRGRAVPDQPARWRHRAEPDGGGLRGAPRSLVEPGGRGPGLGPGAPDRPRAAGHDLSPDHARQH